MFSARPPCPDCASMGPARCKNSARIFGVTSITFYINLLVPFLHISFFQYIYLNPFSKVGISAFDPSLPGLEGNRTEDCILETIGKPVFKR